MIFCREVYCTRSSYLAVSIGNNILYFKKELWNYNSNLIKEIYISGLNLQRLSPEFVISFSTIYIWDLELRFG
jgi:hypothetical protein